MWKKIVILFAGTMGLVAPPVAATAAMAGAPRAGSSPITAATASRCTLNLIGSLAAESTSKVDQQTSSWVLIQRGNWSAWVPTSGWTMSFSDAGADIHSPGGGSDASLASFSAAPGEPYTLASLGKLMLAGVKDIHYICKTAVDRTSSDEIQGTELTGLYGHETIHAVLILAVYSASGDGEVWDLFSPVSQWSTSWETDLMLIIRRAIEVPQSGVQKP